MTFSNKKIDNPNFYLAFSERSGRNPKDNSQLTLVVGGDYDWLFYHDPDYPNDMELGSKIRHYIYWLKGNKDDKKNG